MQRRQQRGTPSKSERLWSHSGLTGGRIVDDMSIAGVSAGHTADFPPLPGTQHISDGILDQLPIGIATFDAERRLVGYNRRAAELWGHAPELGVAVGLIDLPAEVLRTRAPLRDREITFERDDGSKVLVSANADPLLDEQGEVTGVVVC